MFEHLFFRVSGGLVSSFTEHRTVRVFFYRTSGGPGFQQSQNSGGRANFSSNNQSTWSAQESRKKTKINKPQILEENAI